MPDREKVIRCETGTIDRSRVIYDIERCLCHVPDACRDCSHYVGGTYDAMSCMENLLAEASVLLQAHEPEHVSIKDSDGGETHWYVCGACKVPINPGDKYCHECGKAVKWDAAD